MKEITAVAGVLRREGKFLAVERPEGKVMAGYWEFPGGKVEKGESPHDALCRELEEELGITGITASFRQTVVHAYAHGRVTLHVFFVDSFSGEPVPMENQKLLWVEPASAGALRFLPADLPLVRDLARLEQNALFTE